MSPARPSSSAWTTMNESLNGAGANTLEVKTITPNIAAVAKRLEDNLTGSQALLSAHSKLFCHHMVRARTVWKDKCN